jgi:hypothetical protein
METQPLAARELAALIAVEDVRLAMFSEPSSATLALNSGEWLPLVFILDRHFNHGIHLEHRFEYPRPPLSEGSQPWPPPDRPDCIGLPGFSKTQFAVSTCASRDGASCLAGELAELEIRHAYRGGPASYFVPFGQRLLQRRAKSQRIYARQ